MTFKARKEVSVLPTPLEADTLYLVRSGEGFDLYCSDSTGSIAHKVNSSDVLVFEGGDSSTNFYPITLDMGVSA